VDQDANVAMTRSQLSTKKDQELRVMAIAIRIGRRVEKEIQVLIAANRGKTMVDYREALRVASEGLTTKISHGAHEEGIVTIHPRTNVGILAIARGTVPGRLVVDIVLDHPELRGASIEAALL
jgi:hypothetical protein